MIENVIQTDAALTRGATPARALADSAGLVVGINTAVAGVGLGLAVPADAYLLLYAATPASAAPTWASPAATGRCRRPSDRPAARPPASRSAR